MFRPCSRFPLISAQTVVRLSPTFGHSHRPLEPGVSNAFVLNIVRTRTFSAKDFVETRREGACRLASSLAQELAPTMATWAKLVAPYAEAVARHVPRLAKSGLGMTTPIGPKPALDRARVKMRLRPIVAPAMPQASRSVSVSIASNGCRSCGAKLAVHKRLFCDRCLPDRRQEVLSAAARSFQAAGPENRHHARRWP